jgi:Domain of unknown function (DUF4410)
MQKPGSLLWIAVVSALAACSHARVQTTEAYLGRPVSRPDRVLVSYFSIDPEQVRLDQGVSARIMRAASDQPLDAQQLQAARDTQTALAERLVDRLTTYGLPARIATTNDGRGTELLIQGQIVSIDQGNRTRRVLIGLGAGKSTVSAAAQIYYLAGATPPRFMTAFEAQADSGHMPGAAETMGAGAAAQRVGTSAALTGATHAGAETRHTSDTAEADRLADEIALRIGQLAVDQGWIAKAALQ